MKDRARILFTIPNFITAGSGRALLNIIERLDRTRFAPTICVMRRGGDLEQEVERLKVPLIQASFTVSATPYHTLALRAWQAAQPFRERRFDLWHSMHYSDEYTEGIIARMAGARAWIITKKNMGWSTRAWTLRSHLATRIIAQNSDMVERFFNRGRLARKVRVIPRGITTDRFQPGVPPRLAIRQHLRVNGNALIACVANLVPYKGHPTLLRAMAQLPDAHVLLAGMELDRAYASGLRRLAAEVGIANRVHFLGKVTDVPALLAECDIAVLSSSRLGGHEEGCPVAVLEAMSSGKPCVVTNVAGSKDLVLDGITGRVVPADDPHALARAIAALASSPEMRSMMGTNARQRVLDRFTMAHEVARHEALYAELL